MGSFLRTLPFPSTTPTGPCGVHESLRRPSSFRVSFADPTTGSSHEGTELQPAGVASEIPGLVQTPSGRVDE